MTDDERFKETLLRKDADATLKRPADETAFAPPAQRGLSTPAQIDRYDIVGVLGEGGFGRVYLAEDKQLRRQVAVKVPHHRVTDKTDADRFLQEAQIVAQLDHPGIVPVYDAGCTVDACFVVSKYVPGEELAKWAKAARGKFANIAALVAEIADALQHAHEHGLVHRDIKPANILLDNDGKPYLADFGLALRDEDFGSGPHLAGTPAYMSPEQARGEGHRVDIRSDIFGLGVVLYELLAGQIPFQGRGLAEMRDRIIHEDPRPPSQLIEALPWELQRICLKAMSKRAGDRYASARLFSADLRHFISTSKRGSQAVGLAGEFLAGPPRIVPKGLRSFDREDADFFIELLPGPRDRDGLPDSVRFWKTRIESKPGDSTFSVGLLYGPSGAGKSSFVKAGLLPRLQKNVCSVLIEARTDDTEVRLLSAIRRARPDLPAADTLTEILQAVRRDDATDSPKLLLVLDQFEQWLAAHQGRDDAALIQALRQCDGVSAQCLLLIRDDFWMAATWMMRQLEVELVEGGNSSAVQLFDAAHARSVLTRFGKAYGRLPDSELSVQQQAFVAAAVEELNEDGRVSPLGLSLLAEMWKSKSWTQENYLAFGGARGVGVAFLEETLSSSTSPPEYRRHEAVARRVLELMLAESGALKGDARSYHELLAASGYAQRPAEFDRLIQILDTELRLITPLPQDDAEPSPLSRRYQLTHDVLAPALQEWIWRHQRQTRRGRAQLLLEERARWWADQPVTQRLPTLLEWLQIATCVPRTVLKDSQRGMMSAARRHYLTRAAAVVGVVTTVCLAVAWFVFAAKRRVDENYARVLIQRLADSETSQLDSVLAEIADYGNLTTPLLVEQHHGAPRSSRSALHVKLALLPTDASLAPGIYASLLTASPSAFGTLRGVLVRHDREFRQRIIETLTRETDASQRFRAACSLADVSPADALWDEIAEETAQQLVQQHALALQRWTESLRPVRSKLLSTLHELCLDGDGASRDKAAGIVADLAVDQPTSVLPVFLNAHPAQLDLLLERLADATPEVTRRLSRHLQQRRSPPPGSPLLESWAGRQANAAAGLYYFGQRDEAYRLLRRNADPRLRSLLEERLARLQVDPLPMVEKLLSYPAHDEVDADVRAAIVLVLGERAPLADERRVTITKHLSRVFHDQPDPELRAAAEWWLRRRGEQRNLLTAEMTNPSWQEGQRCYVNAARQAMVVLHPQPWFLMGSPSSEQQRDPDEALHRRKIDRVFAIGAHEVSIDVFQRFLDAQPQLASTRREIAASTKRYSPEAECPQVAVTWYEAAAFCRWLSELEGIPENQMCYPPVAEIRDGMVLPDNFLERTGYRLPTEAEWEFACRAGTLTSCYFGEASNQLSRYGWYAANAEDRTQRRAQLRPNAFGLFDLYGNVWEWTNSHYQPYPDDKGQAIHQDRLFKQQVRDSDRRVLRGGAFTDPPRSLRSSHRVRFQPSNRNDDIGFRPARTLR